MVVWPCLKVFWFSKINFTGDIERKKNEIDIRGGNTISKSKQGWTLQAQLGQDKIVSGCSEVIYCVPTTLQGFWINYTRLDYYFNKCNNLEGKRFIRNFHQC